MNFKPYFILGLISISLTGCVNQAVIKQKQLELQQTIPVCKSEKECELKWSAARRWVLSNAGQKFQHVTNDFMETYNPPEHSASIAVRVIKEPLEDGSGYRLLVGVWCNNMFGCVPNKWDAALSFNKYVSSVTLSNL